MLCPCRHAQACLPPASSSDDDAPQPGTAHPPNRHASDEASNSPPPTHLHWSFAGLNTSVEYQAGGSWTCSHSNVMASACPPPRDVLTTAVPLFCLIIATRIPPTPNPFLTLWRLDLGSCYTTLPDLAEHLQHCLLSRERPVFAKTLSHPINLKQCLPMIG